jgi:hypothetical protein
MDETTEKPQKKAGVKNRVGPKDGKKYSKDYQPSSDAKKKGWAKKKFERDLLKDMLNLPYKFLPDSKVKQQLKEAFGPYITNMTVGQVMALQQFQKAILKGDTYAFATLMNQVFGMPNQKLEASAPDGKPLFPNDPLKVTDNKLTIHVMHVPGHNSVAPTAESDM